ncbi:hypothetical protein Tco_1030606 [Tanacetum coccineum]|uniref:Uncharacterized protein n=1 Tax=Tanacetum coccineum TaxID=301880 RepID=A0ABQ5G769_9ASTR
MDVSGKPPTYFSTWSISSGNIRSHISASSWKRLSSMALHGQLQEVVGSYHREFLHVRDFLARVHVAKFSLEATVQSVCCKTTLSFQNPLSCEWTFGVNAASVARLSVAVSPFSNLNVFVTLKCLLWAMGVGDGIGGNGDDRRSEVSGDGGGVVKARCLSSYSLGGSDMDGLIPDKDSWQFIRCTG